MVKVKITVMKVFTPKEVFGREMKRPDGKIVPPCPYNYKEGQEFIVEDQVIMPPGFCGWAWRDIFKDLSVLWYSGHYPWQETGNTYTSCTDGLRPVVFKLERIEKE